MFNVTKKSIQWGNETLTLESGKVARQADGTVIATYRPGGSLPPYPQQPPIGAMSDREVERQRKMAEGSW